jgi:hypothetical protein
VGWSESEYAEDLFWRTGLVEEGRVDFGALVKELEEEQAYEPDWSSSSWTAAHDWP